MKKLVFVDADVFIAISRSDDSNHKKALKILHRLKEMPVLFITSNYVFSEVVTVLSIRMGRHAALAFIKKIKSPTSIYGVNWVTEEIEALAIEKYKQQKSKNVSFVDCTNMAIVDFHRLDYIFSFDSLYKRNGYQLLTESL